MPEPVVPQSDKSVNELAADLLNQLSDDMLEKTGGDTWRSGQPLVGDPTQTERRKSEAPEAKPQESTSEAAPQSKPQETTPKAEKKLFLDKYETEEEAKRGYHEAVQYAKRSKEEADQAKAELDRIRKSLNGNAKPEPAETNPEDELTAWGIPKDPIVKIVDRAARQAVESIFTPLIEQNKADEEITKRYPDYRAKFSEIEAFAEANPEVASIVQAVNADGKYKLAREFLWLKFDEWKRGQLETDMRAQSEEDKAKIEQAKVDAKITGRSSSETRTRAQTSTDAISDERYERLKELAKAGHPSVLYRETIGRTLPKDYFPEE